MPLLATQSPHGLLGGSPNSTPTADIDVASNDFSGHLEAQQRNDRHTRHQSASDRAVDEAESTKKSTSSNDKAAEETTAKTNDGGSSGQAALEETTLEETILEEKNRGNSPPLQDQTLPQFIVAPTTLESAKVSVELPAISPQSLSSLTLRREAVLSALPAEQSELVDIDLEILTGNPSKKTSPFQGFTPKFSQLHQGGADPAPNGFVGKDNFELVRENILAVLQGKSAVVNKGASGTAGISLDIGLVSSENVNPAPASTASSALGLELAKPASLSEANPQRAFTLQIPAGKPGWDSEVGNQIRWMVGQNNQRVELRLNPPELGSIEVKVKTEGEKTSVTFFAANPAAREMLEAALPRLREMFADSGMELANADVSEHGLHQDQGEERLSSTDDFSSDRDDGMTVVETELGLSLDGSGTGRGGIDYYI